MAYTQAELDAMSTDQLNALGWPVASDAAYTPDYNPLGAGGPYDTTNAQEAISTAPAAQTAPASPSLNVWTGLGALWQGFTNPLTTLEGGAEAATGNPTIVNQQNAQLAQTSQGIQGFLNFIGNPARIGTVLIGGLMIAAGIFGIAGGSHRQIIQLVQPSKKNGAA